MLRINDQAPAAFAARDAILAGNAAATSDIVNFAPPEIARRHHTAWNGMHGDTVQIVRHAPFEYSYQGPHHLLIAAERAERYDGETRVEGLPTSVTRNFSRKLTFVPAGRRFHGWQKPRALTRVTYFYIDPRAPLLDPELNFADVEFKPLIFFFDRDIWDTAMKLKAQVENPAPGRSYYSEALSLVLLHELLRLNNGAAVGEPILHGGLAAWQQKRVADYIEEHLAEDVPLSALAGLVNLSPFHFSRAFRQSFGVPPHRYHLGRRVERAKCMLANVSTSVTEIGQRLGFSESSAFTATFRKFAGRTPTDFRRSLE
ncbi:MAG: AraC family transcriptional regulator [Pseudolabrys sp.]